ncbi:hypothetical protein K4039_18805 [Lyngbya sp. CCAP 1446/10]|nr:hypothetical protein [Lyngbya sp. CCAP 1446/10]
MNESINRAITIKTFSNLLSAVGIAIFYDIAIALPTTIHKLNIEMGRSPFRSHQ